jgi:hypothetical protein
MGNCIATEIPEELQRLNDILDFIEKSDVTFDPTELEDKTRLNPHYRKYALELVRFAFRELDKTVKQASINERLVVDAGLYLFHAYKYFMDTLEYPSKAFFQPLKGVIFEFFLSLKNHYHDNIRNKIKLLVDGVRNISRSYTECMCSYYELKKELENKYW